MFLTIPNVARLVQRALLLSVFGAMALAMPVVTHAADPISKFLLIKLTRENTGVLCSTDAFTECMGFTAARCDELKEEAISTCLGPLPDSINPEQLENSTLEACPQKVYNDAGFPEEKAKMCFNKAMESLAAPGAEKPAADQ